MARVTGASRFLVVTCPTGTFRRAGHGFGKEPIVLTVDNLTDEQLAAIDAEDRLEIEETDDLPDAALPAEGSEDHLAVRELTFEVESLTAQVSSARDQVTTLIRERDELNGRLKDLEQDKADQARSIESLQADLATALKERDLAETDKVERGNRIDTLKQELVEAKAAAKATKPPKADK